MTSTAGMRSVRDLRNDELELLLVSCVELIVCEHCQHRPMGFLCADDMKQEIIGKNCEVCLKVARIEVESEI